MTDLRKAVEELLYAYDKDWLPVGLPNHMKALRQALAMERFSEVNQEIEEALKQPEQEPVAWKHNFIDGNVITHKPADIGRNPKRWTALYSEPKPCPTCEALARTVMMDQTSHDTAPPKREWVGLSDEDKDELLNLDNWTDIVEAVEAKLKEKNT